MPKLKHDILNDVTLDDEFKEIVERHKERKLTDVEKDLKIQADKVIYVINRTIAKLSMVAYLPYFLEDEALLLRQNVKPIEVYFIKDLLGKHGVGGHGQSYSSLLDEYSSVLENIHMKLIAVKGDSMSSSLSDTNFGADPYVSKLIDILFYNNCLREFVYSKKRVKMDRSLMKMVKAMTGFKEMAKIKLYITGEDEAVLDKVLREAYNTNTLLTSSINELKENLEKQRKEMGDQLNKKVGVFEMYNLKMEKVKNDFHNQLEKILADSEEVMMEKSAETEERTVVLAEEAKRITTQYNALLEEHLKSEKQARARRYKIETQVQNWLTKFDQDMGERQAEYEQLEKEFNEEKAEMEALQIKFDEQESEYVVLMKEKTAEQDRIDNELAIEFLLNHSARIIQRSWRAYWQRKLARKKAKKGKGKGKGKGKKKEAEAPAAIIPPSVDMNALLQQDKKFNAGVFEEMKDPNAFSANVVVEL